MIWNETLLINTDVDDDDFFVHIVIPPRWLYICSYSSLPGSSTVKTPTTSALVSTVKPRYNSTKQSSFYMTTANIHSFLNSGWALLEL